jgi:hypothetical protein
MTDLAKHLTEGGHAIDAGGPLPVGRRYTPHNTDSQEKAE